MKAEALGDIFSSVSRKPPSTKQSLEILLSPKRLDLDLKMQATEMVLEMLSKV
jgi:hypothetical protein